MFISSLRRLVLNATSTVIIAGITSYFAQSLFRQKYPGIRSAAPELVGAKTAPVLGGGSFAASPEQIPASGWYEIIKRTYTQINSDRVLAVAAGVTFYGLLSLFPAITVFVSLYGLIADNSTLGSHIAIASAYLPAEAFSIVSDQINRITQGDEATLSLALVGGLGLAVWSANAGMKSMIEALNIAYGVPETRSFLKLNLVSLAMTGSALVVLIILIGAVAAIPVILAYFWLSTTTDMILWIGRWPLVFAMVLLALAALYKFGPDRPGVKWRWITPGGVLGSAGLLTFSMLFSWYAANFANYNETYGSLGAVIGFLTWMWLSSTVDLVGAEFNSEIERQAALASKAA